MMYNKERKEEFIEWKKANTVLPSKNYLKNIFESSAEIENELDKDISNFTVKEILAFYKRLNYNNAKKLQNTNSAFSGYYKWCFGHHYVNDLQNPFKETSNFEILSQCINVYINEKRILTKDQVDKLCRMSNVRNEQDKFIMLALFEGIKGDGYEDLLTAKRTDFDKENLTYKAESGRIYNISEQLYEYAENAWLDEYYYTIPSNRKLRYVPSDLCMKEVKGWKTDNAVIKARRVTKRMNDVFAYISIDSVPMIEFMIPNDLYTSGMIWYIKSRLEELQLSFKDYTQNKAFDIDMKSKYYMYETRKNFYTKYRLLFESTR